MKKLFFCFFLLVMGLVFRGGPNSFANAQTAGGEGEFTLEEITVTAEKRPESAQKTAVSLTAITGEKIREKSYDRLENVLQNVPGLSIQATSPTGSGVYIRGIGSNVDTNIADPSVAINVDGVYYSKGEVAFSTMYDTQRVEVLRGPQGTLYGRNAIGGTVNVVSNNPTDELDAAANFKIGNYNLQVFDAMLNVPITETLSSRFAVMKQDRDSYYEGGGDSADKLGFRGKLSYQPTDRLFMMFTADLSSDKGYGKPQVPAPGSAGNLNLPPFMAWVDPDIPTTGWYTGAVTDDWATDIYHPAPKQDNWFRAYSLEVDYDFPWASLTVMPSLNKNNRDFFLIGAIFGTAMGETEESALEVYSPYEETQKALEVRLQSPADANIKWMVGYYGQDSDNDQTKPPQDPDSYPENEWWTTLYNQPTTTNAYFAQVTLPLADRFRVTGGIRSSTDKREKRYRFGINGGLAPGDPYYEEGGATGSYDSGILTYKDDASNVTYKGGVEFDFNDSSMGYAQVTTGFKAGGLNASAPPTIFEPEELTSYAIGAKNRFLDNRLQVNVEAYYYDYKNFQLQIGKGQVNSLTGTFEMIPMYVINADKGTMYGGEVETDWAVTMNDRIKATLSLMHTEYGSVTVPANPFAGTPDSDIEGVQMSNSPEWSTTLEYDHDIDFSDGSRVTVSLNTKISAGYYTTPEVQLEGAWQDSYHLSNANVTYYAPSGKWSLGFWCNNIENKAQTIRLFPLYRRIISDPRTVGVSLSMKM